MSVRQALKKRIYKTKQSGGDASKLELKLQEIEYTPEQMFNKKTGEYVLVETVPKSEERDSVLLELSAEITELRNLSIKPIWIIPYHIRRELNKIKSYSAYEVEEKIAHFNPSVVEFEERVGRAVFMRLDGKRKRINLWTKREYNY